MTTAADYAVLVPDSGMTGQGGRRGDTGGTTSGTPQVLLAHHLKRSKPTILRSTTRSRANALRRRRSSPLPAAPGGAGAIDRGTPNGRAADQGGTLPGGQKPRHLRLHRRYSELNKMLVLELASDASAS
ncbi:MAG: hypothetical protein IPK78_17295 [Rhodospirillales bacterium]|nr:hypothetical protein [Rhodospirillales bacterium]